MSFRSIDLQFALHRNSDAGQIQHQQQNRPVQDQLQLGEQAEKRAEETRQKSGKVDESAFAQIKDDQGQSQKHGAGGGKKQKHSDEAADTPAQPTQAKHPYKGRHIDLSL